MAINVNTIKGTNLNTIILKAYVYAKKLTRTDGTIYNRYITVVSQIPEKEFSPHISIPEGKTSPTYGVFIEVIGDGDIMRPAGRIGLNKYQKYIESRGYTFIGSAPGVKGATFEEARIAAYQIIKKDMRGGDKKKKEKIETILYYCDAVENRNEEGLDVTNSLNKIRELVKNI